MEVVVCAVWNIWKEQNEFIFTNQGHLFDRWEVHFHHDLLLHRHRVKTTCVQPLIDWLLDLFVTFVDFLFYFPLLDLLHWIVYYGVLSRDYGLWFVAVKLIEN